MNRRSWHLDDIPLRIMIPTLSSGLSAIHNNRIEYSRLNERLILLISAADASKNRPDDSNSYCIAWEKCN